MREIVTAWTGVVFVIFFCRWIYLFMRLRVHNRKSNSIITPLLLIFE